MTETAEITPESRLRRPIEESWAMARDILRQDFGEAVWESWLRPLTLGPCGGADISLFAPTRYASRWITENLGAHIEQRWSEIEPAVGMLKISVGEPVSPSRAAVPSPVSLTPPATGIPVSVAAVAGGGAGAGAGEAASLASAPLNPDFTFERFVVGKSNELANAAAHRVAETGDTQYNPLFLHGGVGLGKTHLMHAVAWHIQKVRPGDRVLYLTAEHFMYRFVQALKFRDTLSFKEQLRSVVVLMVDDVQFIADKNSTQEEFFHTFNVLIEQKKQVIIAADRSPGDLDGVEERIKSRLGQGLVVDVYPAEYELRLGILQARAEAAEAEHEGLRISHKVLDFLAQRISANVRVLEGALNRLIAIATLVGKPITMEMAREALQDVLRESDRKLSIEEIQRKTAEYFNIRLSELLSPRRARAIAQPRQVAMFLCKQMTRRSLPEIGRRFGGRDHTTVMHAVKRVQELREADCAFNEHVELLERALQV